MSTDQLEKLVIHLATLYDQGLPCHDFDGNLVSDPQYDGFVKSLKLIKPQSLAFVGTTPSVYVSNMTTIVHNPPMTSIEKADGANKEKIYGNWIKDCCDSLNYSSEEGKFTQTYKHDGVAIRVNYVKGKLVSAGLRPRDGINGIDVTANVKYVSGILDKLPLPLTLSINGELECYKADFEKVNKALEEAGEELRKNPRNHTYGSINQQKDPSKTADGKISFRGYSITGFDESAQYYTTELERAKWVNKVLKIPFVRVSIHKFEDLAVLESKALELDYEVDGIVLKVNNLDDGEQLGHHGDDPIGNPRGALAWKFAEEVKVAEVASIEWNATRTGRITPVAIFKNPIQLAGTSVSRATCSNLGWIKRMEIGEGTKVNVIKAGKIIPKVIAVLSGKTTPEIPKICPSCLEKLKIVSGHDDNVELMCSNTNCLAKAVSGLTFYLNALGAKGLGESKIEALISNHIIKEFADIYTINVEDMVKNGVFTERESLLVLATVHLVKPVKDNVKMLELIDKAKKVKKKVQAWQFFGALGISNAGKTVGKLLVDNLGSFAKIMEASEEELLAIDGIGPTTAASIVNYFANNSVNKLLQHIELEYPKVGKLSGKKFVLTGGFVEGKTYVEKLIEEAGGKCGSSVSKTTDYVVVGTDAGIKEKKADELGIQKLNIQQLKALI